MLHLQKTFAMDFKQLKLYYKRQNKFMFCKKKLSCQNGNCIIFEFEIVNFVIFFLIQQYCFSSFSHLIILNRRIQMVHRRRAWLAATLTVSLFWCLVWVVGPSFSTHSNNIRCGTRLKRGRALFYYLVLA